VQRRHPEIFHRRYEVISAQKREDGAIMAVLAAEKIEPLSEYLHTLGDGTAFLVLDGVCRSGRTLSAVYKTPRRAGTSIWMYAIAVSADSTLIPTWYGCLHDRSECVVLTRQGVTANTSLYARPSNSGMPCLDSPASVLRPPIAGDPDFNAGSTATSINRYTSDDRYFDSTTRAKKILVLEWNSEPVGFIAFHIDARTLWIDYIVACQNHAARKGIGSVHYHHVENYAKLRGCEDISLWAISNKVDWYGKRGFAEIHNGRNISFGEGQTEIYRPMTHRLVSDAGYYHV
jgi:hypothetical protein